MVGILIECGTCRLRPFRMEDAEALVRHANNPKIAARVRDRFPSPYTRRDARDVPESSIEAARERAGVRPGDRGGRRGGRRDRVVLGTDIERVSAELGYWLGKNTGDEAS